MGRGAAGEGLRGAEGSLQRRRAAPPSASPWLLAAAGLENVDRLGLGSSGAAGQAVAAGKVIARQAGRQAANSLGRRPDQCSASCSLER